MNSISTDKSDSLDTDESLPGKNLGDFRLLETSNSPSSLGNRDLQPWAKQRRLVFKKKTVVAIIFTKIFFHQPYRNGQIFYLKIYA